MPGTSKTRAALAAMFASVSAAAMLAPTQAVAQDQRAAEAIVAYDIEAQPLSSALREFAQQSGVSVLYPYDQLRDRQAPALRGRYARDEALRLLLAGSGVTASVQADGSIRLEDPSRPQPIGADAAQQATDENADSEEIVVTGTRIRGAHPAGSNLTTIARDDIEQTGRSSVQDVLSILPQNFPGSQNDTTQLGSINTGRNIAFGSTVDLRGLGADATLTLLNGRRLAPAGFGNFVDISTVPLAAVERIEVLADGASALYGSDAVAGVVNVILRRDFEGAETTLRYGAATRGDPEETNFSQLFGASWQGGNAMIGYEYRDRTALAAADRDFSATSDLRPWGGSNFSSISTNPGNTDNPHTHIVLRGRRADGRALVLPRDFVKHGFREAARDAATDRLGLRTRADERLALKREVRAHRPTRLDALLARQIDAKGELRIARIEAPNRDPAMTNALKARARELQRLGLAAETRRNVMSFRTDWRSRLTAMELHLDIRKQLLRTPRLELGKTPSLPLPGL
jgi:iron complex outermembrane receptor protein